MNLIVDPEFEEQIPKLSEDEFQLLEQMILEEGRIKDPIVTWNGVIVDGHNRYRIIQKHPEIDLPYTVYEKEFPDRYAAIAWICRNQLGRRNLTPENRKYLIGKQYEAEKASHGGDRWSIRDMETETISRPQNEVMRVSETNATSKRIAKENNTSHTFVERAEQYAKGVDAAEIAVPGTRDAILSGRAKVTDKAVVSIAQADFDERPALIDQILHPPQKEKHMDMEDRSEEALVIVPFEEGNDLSEKSTKQIVLAPTTAEDMFYEMEDALSGMIWRWNNCRTTYPEHLKTINGQKRVKELAEEAIKYFTEVKKGGLWK